MKLAFGVLSSANTAEAIDQICTAVREKHSVLVHHDYSKNPDFVLKSNCAHVVADPVVTNWGDWSLAAAILKLMQEARRNFEFDYFQVLSDSCLPIKPIRHFEEFLDRERPDAMIEAMPLIVDDPLPLLNYSYCYYPSNRIEKTLMRRAAKVVLAKDSPISSRLERGGLALDRARDVTITRRAASLLHALLVKRAQRSFSRMGGRIYCGSTWFCVSREMLEAMLEVNKRLPQLEAHFSRHTQTSDEGFFPTLAMLAKPRKILGFNHYVRWTQRRTGPDELGLSDFDALQDSGKFFARKFPKNPDSEIRRLTLERLVSV